MRVYQLLSRISPIRNKYALKFLLLALPAIMVPSTLLVLVSLHGRSYDSFTRYAVIIGIVLTILLSIGAYFLFTKLLRPIYVTRKAVNKFTTFRKVPELPVDFEDEAGLLMHDVQAALEQVDNLLTEKSDMIDLLSHDLRSPVARIMGLSNLIKIEDETEKDTYADYITTECKNLLTLMENILLMFREDVHAFAPQNVNLLQLIQESVKFFNIAANDKKISLKVDVDETLYINVQQGLFTQAVRNIIGNAIKFSAEKKTIFISSKKVNDEVSIVIRDEGMGMVKEDLNKIFNRFTLSGKQGTRGEASFGLGLYLSKKIIEKQGGKLIAESEGLQKGSSFTITFFQLITKKRK